MKYYLAPMQGITGHIYRNALNKYFGGVDKYFTPFIAPTQNKKLNTRDLRDVLPENNKDINLIPQILTNKSHGFISTCGKLKDLGYSEVNLNLGCPSKTVVSRNRGSGFLSLPDELDQFLYEIFEANDMEISIKTRIGRDDPEEIYKLMEIYNKYPLVELIVHPRTQSDFYENTPNLDMFEYVMKESVNPVAYNGDIFTVNNQDELTKKFSNLEKTMLGRGLIVNPGLINNIENGRKLDKDVLKEFHDEIFNTYIEVFEEDRNAMFRMKELWWYMIHLFTNNKKYAKKIKKSQNKDDYNQAVSNLFREQDLV